MTLDKLRVAALCAVDLALPYFESQLPVGECDEATVLLLLKRRREEILTAARGALDQNARTLPSEVILRLLFGEVSEEELFITPAPEVLKFDETTSQH